MSKRTSATPLRVLYWGSKEHKAYCDKATHVHVVGDEHIIFGDGKTILRSVRPSRRCPKGIADIWGKPTNEWGKPFHYSDYFLPQEIK
jgi:hypothetical protein